MQDMGIIIQTNIKNYVSKAPFFKRRKLLKFIANGWIDILGSDAHSFTHNTPEDFSEAMKTIADKCGEDTLARMMKNSEKIFSRAIFGNWYYHRQTILPVGVFFWKKPFIVNENVVY